MTQISFENRLPAGVVNDKKIEPAVELTQSSNVADKWQEYGAALKNRIEQASLEMAQLYRDYIRVFMSMPESPVAKKMATTLDESRKRIAGLKKRERIVNTSKNSFSDKVFLLQKKSMGVNVFSYEPSDSLAFGDVKTAHGQKRFESLKTKLQNLGITQIERFSDLTNIEVEQLIADCDPNAVDERPLALMVYPTADANGAFNNNEILHLMLQGYRVVYVQAQTDNDCFDAIEKYGKKQKIDLLFIGGHGTPRKTQFSEGLESGFLKDIVSHSDTLIEYLEDSSFLDLQDSEKIKKRNLAQYMNVAAQINLVSCSTGKPDPSKTSEESTNMANMLADAFQVPVYAPQADAASLGIRFNAQGKMIGVDYASAKDNEVISVETYIAIPK